MYKFYEQDANLLEGIGEAELTDEKIKLAEAFICKLCNQVTDTSDEARDLDWVAQISIKFRCQLKLVQPNPDVWKIEESRKSSPY